MRLMTALAPATPGTPSATLAASVSVSTTVLVAATHATPEVKTQDLQQAVDYFQKGSELAHAASTADDYVRAIELFSIAIAIRSDQARFFFARGNAFRAINELDFAAKDYGQAITLDDRTPVYFANRGACYRKLNQPVKALEDLTAAIDMDSKKANHYFNRALVLYDNAFYKEATIDLTKTLEEGSAGIRVEYKALQLRGTCYRKLGHLQKCIHDLQRAIQLDGRNPTGFCSLAQAFLDAGEIDHAIEHFSNAIQFNNTQASYFALRGLCYYRKCNGGSDTAKASGGGDGVGLPDQCARMCLTDFNQSIKLDGKDPQAYFYRGSIRLALVLDTLQLDNPVADASDALPAETPATQVSNGAVSISGLGMTTPAALTVEEQLEASFADIEMAWTLSSKGPKFQVGLAMITQLKKQYETASSLFREVHGSDRANVVVKYHWALCCHMLRDTEIALTLLCDCIDAIATEPLFFEARALVLQEAGHHDLAIGDFGEAIALRNQDSCTPNTATVAWNVYLRSESHLRMAQYDAAIVDATEALEPHATTSVPMPQLLEMSARNARAMAHRGLAQYDQAIDDLTICLRLASANDVFLYHRALCFLECERFAEALPDLYAAIAASPVNRDDPFILYSVGRCYYYEKQPNECIAFLDRARERLQADTTNGSGKSCDFLYDLHYRTGVAHALEGRYIQAIEHFTFAVDHATASTTSSGSPPSDDVVLYIHERAKALQMERYYDECIEDFSFVIHHNPNNAHAYFRRGFAFKALGKLHEAAADLESAKLLSPTNPQLVVKYKEIRDIECLVLCAPGDEPQF